jgi:hypothetical protein
MKMPTKDQNSKPAPQQTDPRGVRIDGYFGPGLLRKEVGKLVQRTGEAQFCGSMVFRAFACEAVESPYRDDSGKPKMSLRFEGEFLGVCHDGKRIYAASGFLPSSIARSTKARVERGENPSFGGDVWCEPAEKAARGYVFTIYDTNPRTEEDELMKLAVRAGIIPPPALPAPGSRFTDDDEIDPETGELIEKRSEAA